MIMKKPLILEKGEYREVSYEELIKSLVAMGYSRPTNFLYISYVNGAKTSVTIDPSLVLPKWLLSDDVNKASDKERYNLKLVRKDGSINADVVLVPPGEQGSNVKALESRRAKLQIEAKYGTATIKLNSVQASLADPYILNVVAGDNVTLYIPSSFHGPLRLRASKGYVSLHGTLPDKSIPLGDSWWTKESKWFVGDISVLGDAWEGDEIVVHATKGNINVYYAEDLEFELQDKGEVTGACSSTSTIAMSQQQGVPRNVWQQLSQECAQGAIYDSNERQPHSKCLPGTRVDLLRTLKEAAEGATDERQIVWIAGESGSGKSTIAHTLADELREEGRLAGTFFFSRKHTKRSAFEHVFLTLSYQLGLQHPIAREVIVKAISDDPALLSSEKSRRDQLDRLVIAPLQALALQWSDARMSMIIDALDEGTASGIHHVKPFVVLLAALIRNPSIPIHRIFVSSRSWPQIRSVMCNNQFADIMRVIRLEDYDSRQDVDRYLRHAFDEIYESHDLSTVLPPGLWPSESETLMLSERAYGRFIFAATIVRFVDQDQPQDRLRLVCSMLRGDVEQVWGNIDHLYSSIIEDIDLPARELGMKYLALIVNLAEPLCPSDLRLFFGVDVYSHLLPFSAFVSIPSVSSSDLVQIHHISFRDFLQKHSQYKGEQTDKRHIHHVLSSACFRTMARLLKRDICNLRDPSLLHEEISDFAQRRDAIPFPLRYSLRHWLHHMKNGSVHGEDQHNLLDFLEKRLLFAIETYAVFGELGTAVELWRSARKFIVNWPDASFPRKKVALALLYDSWRFTLDFFDAISSSSLHVYESALPCCPAKSQIRTTYSRLLEESTILIVEQGLGNHWDYITGVIQVGAKVEYALHYRTPPVSLSPD
ncbi:hypothetical protein CONPUDRAFT_169426, partial [Coniophora puteana RWD-64-598 SS2]